MTEKQFFEQWNRIFASGKIDIPERIDWREVRYMLAYFHRRDIQAWLDEFDNRPYQFVWWCAKNYWSLNKDFWNAQTKMLSDLEQLAATKKLQPVEGKSDDRRSTVKPSV